jgi:hypothetical protein
VGVRDGRPLLADGSTPRVTAAMSSSRIQGVGRDAEFIAGHIAARTTQPHVPAPAPV